MGDKHVTEQCRIKLKRAVAMALAGLACGGIAQAQTAPTPAPQTAPVEEAGLGATGVTGYTTEKKKNVVGAISLVDLKETEDKPAGSIIQQLQGEIPGVQITTDGNPGAGPPVLTPA